MKFKTPELQEAWDHGDPVAFVPAALDVAEPITKLVNADEQGLTFIHELGRDYIRAYHRPVRAWHRMGNPESTIPAIAATWRAEDLLA